MRLVNRDKHTSEKLFSIIKKYNWWNLKLNRLAKERISDLEDISKQSTKSNEIKNKNGSLKKWNIKWKAYHRTVQNT